MEEKKDEVKKEEVKKEEPNNVGPQKEVKDAPRPPKRQIIIETDGNSINIVKAEVAGNIELRAILEGLAELLKPKEL